MSVPCLQSTSQVLAVRSMLEKAETGKELPAMSARHAGEMRTHSMFQYWQSCVTACKPMDRWHASLDGVTVSGEHSVPFLHYTPQNKLLTFGPPQVKISCYTPPPCLAQGPQNTTTCPGPGPPEQRKARCTTKSCTPYFSMFNFGKVLPQRGLSPVLCSPRCVF